MTSDVLCGICKVAAEIYPCAVLKFDGLIKNLTTSSKECQLSMFSTEDSCNTSNSLTGHVTGRSRRIKMLLMMLLVWLMMLSR